MGDAHWGRDRERKNEKERLRWFSQNRTSSLETGGCLPDTHWAREDPVAAVVLGLPGALGWLLPEALVLLSKGLCLTQSLSEGVQPPARSLGEQSQPRAAAAQAEPPTCASRGMCMDEAVYLHLSAPKHSLSILHQAQLCTRPGGQGCSLQKNNTQRLTDSSQKSQPGTPGSTMQC